MLQDDGILQNKRGIGFFTSAEARNIVLEKKKAEFIRTDLPAFFDSMRQLGLSPDDLKKMYESYSKESGNHEAL
jgi:DNA-binding transcriptional regulator YhcF (GntR family)